MKSLECPGCRGSGRCPTCRGEGKRVRVWRNLLRRERMEVVVCKTCLGSRACRMCWSSPALEEAAGQKSG